MPSAVTFYGVSLQGRKQSWPLATECHHSNMLQHGRVPTGAVPEPRKVWNVLLGSPAMQLTVQWHRVEELRRSEEAVERKSLARSFRT